MDSGRDFGRLGRGIDEHSLHSGDFVQDVRGVPPRTSSEVGKDPVPVTVVLSHRDRTGWTVRSDGVHEQIGNRGVDSTVEERRTSPYHIGGVAHRMRSHDQRNVPLTCDVEAVPLPTAQGALLAEETATADRTDERRIAGRTRVVHPTSVATPSLTFPGGKTRRNDGKSRPGGCSKKSMAGKQVITTGNPARCLKSGVQSA